ncbi:MAG: branched-chain amino acid transport system permease protein [Chloroflexota bacterium]|nr:branched-chain amino acid transport system permease protein [Chloroflexota bacterium]
MSDAMQFYISTLLIYLFIDIIGVLGLNLQFGVAGIINFAYIAFVAVGAYTAAVLTLGPDYPGNLQHYVFGANLPFPLPILAAGAVSGALSLVVGLISLRRLRSDYQAMVMLVLSLIATLVATNAIGLVNGPAGLGPVPQPLYEQLGLAPLDYQWVYAGWAGFIAVLTFLFVQGITNSPLGRTLRAMRDNDRAAAALGKSVTRLRLMIFVVGGVIAGISGAVFVEFIQAWSPGSWLYQETFVFFAAILVGGAANNLGVMVGTLLVPVGFLEATKFLPEMFYKGFIEAMQWVCVGLLILLFLWFRPNGIFPEKPGRFRPRAATQTERPVR